MEDLVNISIPTADGTALLGYLVVFFGLVLLMVVLLVMGSIFTKKKRALHDFVSLAVVIRGEEAPEKENPFHV